LFTARAAALPYGVFKKEVLCLVFYSTIKTGVLFSLADYEEI
jgi:hypothetical protein